MQLQADEQRPDLKLTSHFVAANMTPTNDLKSPHEEVITIDTPVESVSKSPTTFAKLSFVFIVASGIIYWFYFIIDPIFYIRYTITPDFIPFGQPTYRISESLKLFVFLCNTIAYVVICLHIFTSRFRGSKITAVIAAFVCIFTSSSWLIQLSAEDIAGIGFALHIAAHYIQSITGLMMVIEMFFVT